MGGSTTVYRNNGSKRSTYAGGLGQAPGTSRTVTAGDERAPTPDPLAPYERTEGWWGAVAVLVVSLRTERRGVDGHTGSDKPGSGALWTRFLGPQLQRLSGNPGTAGIKPCRRSVVRQS